MTEDEQQYYDNCIAIYKELKNTKLYEYLTTLREKIIHKIARTDDEKKLWKEVGRLHLLDDLTDKKITSYTEIKRIDALKDEEKNES